MNFKIDTKEKFVVITPETPDFNDKMAEILQNHAETILRGKIRNIVLNMELVEKIDSSTAVLLAKLQQNSYELGASFVFCHVGERVNEVFKQEDIFDFINQTPTESEAWDMVQMEEIERELLDGGE